MEKNRRGFLQILDDSRLSQWTWALHLISASLGLWRQNWRDLDWAVILSTRSQKFDDFLGVGFPGLVLVSHLWRWHWPCRWSACLNWWLLRSLVKSHEKPLGYIDCCIHIWSYNVIYIYICINYILFLIASSWHMVMACHGHGRWVYTQQQCKDCITPSYAVACLTEIVVFVGNTSHQYIFCSLVTAYYWYCWQTCNLPSGTHTLQQHTVCFKGTLVDQFHWHVWLPGGAFSVVFAPGNSLIANLFVGLALKRSFAQGVWRFLPIPPLVACLPLAAVITAIWSPKWRLMAGTFARALAETDLKMPKHWRLVFNQHNEHWVALNNAPRFQLRLYSGYEALLGLEAVQCRPAPTTQPSEKCRAGEHPIKIFRNQFISIHEPINIHQYA